MFVTHIRSSVSVDQDSRGTSLSPVEDQVTRDVVRDLNDRGRESVCEYREEILQLLEEGYTTSDIMDRLGCTKYAVRRVRARNGADAREQTDAERKLDPTIRD